MSDTGLAELVSGFCHTDEENPFPLWQNGHISPCFNQLILGVLPHAAVAVFSAYYLGMARCVVGYPLFITNIYTSVASTYFLFIM